MPSGMTAAEVSSRGSRKSGLGEGDDRDRLARARREDHHVGGVAGLQLRGDLRVVGVGRVGDHLDLDAGLLGVLRRDLRVVVVGVVRLGDHDREADVFAGCFGAVAAVVGGAGTAGEDQDTGDGDREKRPPEVPAGGEL